MKSPIVQSTAGVTLVGGAPISGAALRAALAVAPRLVAADSGADRVLRLGLMPEVAVGDLDSISAQARAALGPERLHHIAEQETTDFDKALREIVAPFVLALGFSGGQVDHGLAALNTLARNEARRIFLLGARDVTFLAPRDLVLHLPVGTRLSLFPLGEVRGESEGLRWPIGGLRFAPDGVIGTSNEVSDPWVRLRFDVARMLVVVPRVRLTAVLRALVPEHVTQDAPRGVRGG